MEAAEPRWFDLAVLSWLAVATPWIGWWGYRRLQRRLAAGDGGARLRLYRTTIVAEWVSAIALLALWLGASRGLAALGLGAGVGGWRLWLGAALTLTFLLFQLRQVITVRRSPEERRRLRKTMAHLAEGLPHDRAELRAFFGLSLTAGFCEELVYRGYAIWLLAAYAGPWVALGGSAVLFALGHVYQGPRTLPAILFVGLVTGGLYLLTGSLWAPIVVHATIDVTSGQMLHAALAEGDAEETAAAVAEGS